MERTISQWLSVVLAHPARIHSCALGMPIRLAALLLVLLPLVPFKSVAGCGMDISYQIYPSHITYYGDCSSYSEAVATCQAIAVEHGYTPNYCGINGNTTQGTAWGGWFWQQHNVTIEPFHFVRLHYGTLLPPKEYDNLGPPPCEDQCFGDPVNAGNGNKFEHVMEFLGAGSFPLQVSWDYNSRLDGTYRHPKVMIFGNKRSHFYGRSVVAISSTQATVAFVARSDGNAIRFELLASGWQGPSNRSERLTEVMSNGVRTGWRLDDAQGGYETYNAAGLLVTLTSANNQSQTLAYDTSNLLTSVTDAQGRQLQFSYNSSSRVSAITLPSGDIVLFRYTEAGYLSEVEHPGGGIKEYRYNEASYSNGGQGLLTGVIDESLNRLSSTFYDNDGRATGTKEGNDLTQHFAATYTPSGGYNYSPTTSITLPSGATRTMQFTVKGGKIVPLSGTTSCTGCVSSVTSYTHNDNGDLTATTTNGVTKNFSHDAIGRVEEVVEASNDVAGRKRTLQTDWHSTLDLATEHRIYDAGDALVAKSTYAYNIRGQRLTSSELDPATGTTRTTVIAYCEQTDVAAGTCPLVGLIKSVDGTRTDLADTTTYTYYLTDDVTCATAPTTCPHRKGDLWKVTNALGHVTETLRYDGAGRVLSVKDPNGVITDFEYHPRGWLTARKTRGADGASEADDQITRIDYWPTGLVKQVTQPDGAFTAYTYDAARRLTDIADNTGNQIHYVLDNAGNRIQEDTKDAGGNLKRTLSRIYNQLGQLATQADAQANPTDFTYDPNGNTDTVTDALGRVTDNDHDPLNRLARTLQDVGGIAAETKFQYDALDNLVEVTDPKGLETTYTYNGLGDLTQLQSPDTGTTAYTYDSAGNRASRTDARGKLFTYSYDALNRLTGVGYPNTSYDVVYTYDTNQSVCTIGETFSQGRLTKLKDGSGTTQYCYDRFGDLVRKVQTTNGKVFTLRYAYTKAGQLQSVTYPDGMVADYVRDAQGQIAEVGVTRFGNPREVLLYQASYYPFGSVAGWSYGNDRQMTRSLDQDYRPIAVQDSGTDGLSLNFGFDPVGNLTQLSSGSPPPLNYVYDSLGRLTETRDSPTQVAIDTYTYDKTGNRTSLTNSSGTQTYIYPTNRHRLTQVGSVVRTYDAVGNTTQIGGTARQFIYDDTGRMGQVRANGAVKMNYRYNGDGEQVRKYLGTVNTYTVYDESGHWLGDYDTNGAVIQQAIWLDDLPVGLIANGNQLHYIEPDHLGTPRVVIEVARDMPVWTWDAKGEAFGNTSPDQNPDGDANAFVFNMRFPGQRHDAASGLSYNYFRDYDPSSGRYVESDPIGLDGGIGTYAYATNAPLVSNDANGLQSVLVLPRPMPLPLPLPRPLPRPIPYPIDPILPAPSQSLPHSNEHSERLPRTDSCKASEWDICRVRCPGRVNGCYVSISWKARGSRGGGLIRSEERTVNCNCADDEFLACR